MKQGWRGGVEQREQRREEGEGGEGAIGGEYAPPWTFLTLGGCGEAVGVCSDTVTRRQSLSSGAGANVPLLLL